VNIVVNLLMGPSPRRLATDRLGHCLREAASALHGNADALHAALHDGVQPVAGWLRLAKAEGTVNAQDLRALQQAMASTMAILLAVDVARRQPGAPLPAATAAPIADTLDEMARMLDAGGYPVEIGLPPPPLDNLSPVQQAVVRELVAAIQGYAEPGAAASPAAASKAAHGGFLSADAFTNPDHVRYALKTTGAAMFCYLLYQQLNWPSIHTCFITCYLVSLGTMAETVEKLTLRLAGCMIGAVIGTAAIVYVVPGLSSVGGLLLLVFAGTWISAWVAQGSPRIAYAGFQIAFAFYLCVVQGAAPGYDLTIARDRVIGVMLGNLVVYLVFTHVWPVSIAGRIESALAALVAQWHALVHAPQPAARREHAAAALALHGEITQDLILAHYEPASVGQPPQWASIHRDRLATLDAISGPVFLLAERFPGDPALAQRLNRLRPDGPPLAAAQPGATIPTDSHDDPARQALLAIIDQQLEASHADAPVAAAPNPIHAQT
jgi:multidrug resistance protein MdtO